MAEQSAVERRGEVMSAKELDLIHELIRTRLETERKLEYESLDGYEVPPRTQFSMLKKPAITIKYGHLICNMAAIRLFAGVKYVLPMVNSKTQRLAIVPCAEEESASVEWAYQRIKDDVWQNKSITSMDFAESIFDVMNWNRECRYKVLGRLAESDRGLILIFDLSEAIMFEPNKEEYVDPRTGAIKKRQITYYPDFYKGRIGRSYNDYSRARQLSLFESLDAYASGEAASTHSAAPGVGQAETVREKSTTQMQETSIGERYQTNPEMTAAEQSDSQAGDEYAGSSGSTEIDSQNPYCG